MMAVCFNSAMLKVSIVVMLSLITTPISEAFSPSVVARRRGMPKKTCLQETTAHPRALGDAKSSSSLSNNIFQDYDKPIVLMGKNYSVMKKLAGHLASQLNSVVADSVDTASALDVLILNFEDTNQDSSTHTVKSLYQDKQVLVIYINVQGEADEKLEREVFLPFTDYELCLTSGDASNILANDGPDDYWLHWELTRLVARALLPPAIPGDTLQSVNTAHLTMGSNTFFLSLSFPSITGVEPYVKEMCRDVDAMEYRADLLDCRDSRFELLYGMQQLRRYCRPHALRVPALPLMGTVLDDNMPILYTVRTQNQAGTYPDDNEGITRMFEMLEWGLRGGVEVLDVESAWDEVKTENLLNLAEARYSSQILGSHHVVGKMVELEDAVQLFQQCGLGGRAHGAKVVLSIDTDENDRMAYEAALISQSLAEQDGLPVIPSISLVLGEVGQFSRIINTHFTPVTHESLPFKAAPGQLTANEIMATRLLTKLVTSQTYCILGHNIAYSVSPQMHNAAFEAVRLPHAYARADVEKVEEFIESDFFKGQAFGGASVTIPHKQSIIPYVDVLSEAAEAIGSVNTLVVYEELGEEEVERVIYGDNTDWRGIYNPLRRILRPSANRGYALILGAGGTARAAAYAADMLGLDRLYHNRTPRKAQDLVENFGGQLVASLDSDGDLAEKNIDVVISTLPAAAEFELPSWLLPMKPVVFDVNYKPYSTKLLEQAISAGCKIVRGSEMLWEQGVGQFELWTERTAPYKVMKRVVLENCLPKQEDKDAFQ